MRGSISGVIYEAKFRRLRLGNRVRRFTGSSTFTGLRRLRRGTFSACRSAMACIMAAHSSSVTDTPYFLAHTRTRSTGTIMVTRFLYPSFSGVPLR